MAQKIQLRHGTAAEWTAANPTLAIGEVGVEVDTRLHKIGNGSTAWNALAYPPGGNGGGSFVIVQEGDVTTEAQASTLDFDPADFVVTPGPAGEANFAISQNLARVLTPFAATGSFNITNAAHARDGVATNAAAIAATFDFTGMPTGASGAIRQGGAGVVTLQPNAVGGAAITYSYAPGITASPTTAGLGGTIAWTYLGANAVLIEYRSQASAGGASAITKHGTAADITIAQVAAENAITTITLPTPEVGMLITIDMPVARTAVAGGGVIYFKWQGNVLDVDANYIMSSSNTILSERVQRTFKIAAVGASGRIIGHMTPNSPGGGSIDPGLLVNMSGGLTLALSCEFGAPDIARVNKVRGVDVRVERVA